MKKSFVFIYILLIIFLSSCSSPKTLEVYFGGVNKTTLKAYERYLSLDDLSKSIYELYTLTLNGENLIVKEGQSSSNTHFATYCHGIIEL